MSERPVMTPWNNEDIPDQSGRTAIVTGCTSGTGEQTAHQLARTGAHVVMACRNRSKSDKVRADIMDRYPQASVDIVDVDLGSQKSCHEAIRVIHKRYSKIDVLVNNAGIMKGTFARTEDGFEKQIAANHLGHFTLTCGVLPLMRAVPDSRVVSVSSIAHLGAFKVDLSDLNFERRSYTPYLGYKQSKFATLLFALALHRRLEQAGASTISIPVHPGVSSTSIANNSSDAERWFITNMAGRIANDALGGAIPSLYAATSPGAVAGQYYGPNRWFESHGYPAPASPAPLALLESMQEQLLAESEKLTGVTLNLA